MCRSQSKRTKVKAPARSKAVGIKKLASKPVSTMKMRGGSTAKGHSAMGSLANEANAQPQILDTALISQVNATTPLLRLPIEVRQRIFTLAVKHDKTIHPIQIRPRSNKFFWAHSQVDRTPFSKHVYVPPRLAGVDLTKVCKQIYQEVAGTHLFYRHNLFYLEIRDQDQYIHVRRPVTGTSFIFAITTPRLHAIRSIACDWQGDADDDLFRALAVCQGLQSLKLYFISKTASLAAVMNEVTNSQALKTLVRGLKELTVMPNKHTDIRRRIPRPKSEYKDDIKLCRNVEQLLRPHMKEARFITNAMTAKFTELLLKSSLDVYGEGRLGADLKPGVVSSRTRYQTRRAAMMKPDGTLPERTWSKYDSEGNLLWHIVKVVDSREAVDHSSQSGVEFLVEYFIAPNYGYHYYGASGQEYCLSWEDATVLQSFASRRNIISYYDKNTMAAGKEALVAFWQSLYPEMVKVETNENHIRRIEDLIDRDTAIEVAEAAKAAKKSPKGFKVAKASNAAEVRKHAKGRSL